MFSRRTAIGGGLIGALVVGLAATIALPPVPRLVWNVSESAPVGLWHVAPAMPLRRGDMVAARLPRPWGGLASGRHYLPANVPLIKRIAAGAGDRICASRGEIRVNDTAVAARLHFDGVGRSIPGWRGCVTLGPGEFLLLMDAENSFDGRYFGPTARRDIIGKAIPLWVR